MSTNNKNYSTQEAVNPAFSCVAFGGTVLNAPRAVVAEVERKFKVTYVSGARAYHTFIPYLEAPRQIIGVSASDGGAISSTSALIYALY